MLILDKKTYNKALKYPIGVGYGRQRPKHLIKSIVVHTTNGKKGTTFAKECEYIYNSPLISAHYLCGRDYPRVVEFLAPEYIAWHAGEVIDNRYGNVVSIGIENHCTVNESWTKQLHTNLTNLTIKLLNDYPSITLIETHRKVAPKRKIDPSGFPDKEFYTWSNTVLLYTSRITRAQFITKNTTIIYQGPNRSYPVAGVVEKDTKFVSLVAKYENEEFWLHITEGQHAHLGFVPMSELYFNA